MLNASDSESCLAPQVPQGRAARKMLQNVPDLMATLSQLDEDSLQQIRRTAEEPPRVSVFDVLRVVTGYPDDRSRVLYRRLLEVYPEVAASCTYFRFPGNSQRETPVVDAEGVSHIIMSLPGRASVSVRRCAADAVVRHAHGDSFPLREITLSRHIQAVEPEQPASVFGQPPTPYETRRAELEMAKNARMQALSAAFQLAQAIESTSLARLRVEAQKAIDDTLLPQGESATEFVDAAAILRERAHTESQISRLAGELGKDLKMVAENEESNAQSNEQSFGSDRHQVGLYHRVRQASLIEDVLASFKQRALYTRVMAGEPDPIASRRQGLLSSQGRGRIDRSRSVRRVG